MFRASDKVPVIFVSTQLPPPCGDGRIQKEICMKTCAFRGGRAVDGAIRVAFLFYARSVTYRISSAGIVAMSSEYGGGIKAGFYKDSGAEKSNSATSSIVSAKQAIQISSLE